MNKFHSLPYMGANEVLCGLSAATAGTNPYWGYSALKETRR